MLTMPAMAGNEREENPPRLLTPRRAALPSARQNEGYLRNRLTGGKTYLLHGTGHSTKECKVLKENSTKYAAQRPHNERKARSCGNKTW